MMKTPSAASLTEIIRTKEACGFGALRTDRARILVSCCSNIVDLNAPMRGRWYDVRDDFFSAVPLLMYLKWACADVGWSPNELGGCLIIDDPFLKTKYGFCDFRQVQEQTKEHSFSASVAFIPWNWRRTSKEMASLIRNSQGRLSVSVHGCDHTGAEFGSHQLETVAAKADLAKQRMNSHMARTGVPHDLVMIFPQGVFSRESLTALQHLQFLAAVNTEVLPTHTEDGAPTIGEIWTTALIQYEGCALFPRRYPDHGLVNFAFDLLLGKPCLIVEHHDFFKDSGHAMAFIDSINALSSDLKWRGLGEVLRRAYLWRKGSEERSIDVRMFANEIVLSNESRVPQSYDIHKKTGGHAHLVAVTANGRTLDWEADADSARFAAVLEPGTEVLIQTQYAPPGTMASLDEGLTGVAAVALRRYLSEWRDNTLSRHDGLLRFARRARRALLRN